MAEQEHRAPSVIRLEGTFDLPAARLLENALKRMRTGEPVRVDFTRVRDFRDFAVALLAQALKRPGAPDAKLEGLRLHQVRLLRYFGVGPEVFRAEGATPSRSP
jgi:anti-anti-sigma regulatory factor